MYKTIIYIANRLPLNTFLFIFIKKINLYKFKNLYLDLKINGLFKLKVDNKIFIKLYGNNDNISNHLFWKGIDYGFEPEVMWIYKIISKKVNYILDVGSNTGIYSLVSKSINQNSQVYAFEPVKRTYNKLKRNININKFNINTFEIALSDKDGENTIFDVPNENQTSSSLSPLKLKKWKGYKGEIIEYKIKTMRLDTFVLNNKIKNIEFIKVDIECHEPEFIKGGINSIEKFKPIIIIEILYNKIGRLVQSEMSNDWEFYHLSKTRKLVRSVDLRRIDGEWNYLLIHKTKKTILKGLI
tara:strand:+ start:2691 stop:3584 length:894 start_codon:yes stop_codon:yes gene_type:complete